MNPVRVAALLVLAIGIGGASGADPPRRTPREALQAFNDLVGSWRITGEPAGQPREFWQEKVAWQWRFQGKEAWLQAQFDKGRCFSTAELHYLPGRDAFRLSVHTTAGRKLVFEGPLADRRLVVQRHDDATGEDQRLVLRLLHFNRHLVRYETRPAGRTTFTAAWQTGATKEGVPFASQDNGPECVVSGGLGTIPLTYKGRTYYVCCTGCRDAFRDEPKKYVREYEARKKNKK
jgi:hypothetical protein